MSAHQFMMAFFPDERAAAAAFAATMERAACGAVVTDGDGTRHVKRCGPVHRFFDMEIEDAALGGDAILSGMRDKMRADCQVDWATWRPGFFDGGGRHVESEFRFLGAPDMTKGIVAYSMAMRVPPDSTPGIATLDAGFFNDCPEGRIRSQYPSLEFEIVREP